MLTRKSKTLVVQNKAKPSQPILYQVKKLCGDVAGEPECSSMNKWTTPAKQVTLTAKPQA